jgi:hypothetical protein
MGCARRKGGDLHRQPVAPSIFAPSERRDSVPQLAVGLSAKDARRRANLPFSNADHYLPILLYIPDPRGHLTRLVVS